MTTSARIILPEDLCREIASWLDDADLENTYLINSSFRRLASEAQNRHVILFPHPNWTASRMIKYLQALSNPCRAPDVRTLKIDTFNIGTKGMISFRLEAFKGSMTSKNSIMIKTLTRNLFNNLHNLQSVSVVCCGHNSPLFSDIVSLLWKRHLETMMPIRHLSLQLHGLPIVFAPMLPEQGNAKQLHAVFSSLTSLNITVSCARKHRIEGYETVTDGLCQLIRAVSAPPFEGQAKDSKLTTLSIHLTHSDRAPAFWRSMKNVLFLIPPDPSALTSNPFPNLKHLSVVDDTPGEGWLWDKPTLFKTVLAQLTHLRVSANVEVWNKIPEMRYLEYLEVVGSRQLYNPGLGSTIEFMARCRPGRLKSLVIGNGWPLTWYELERSLLVKDMLSGKPIPSYMTPPAFMTPESDILFNTIKLRYTECLSRLQCLTIAIIILTPKHLFMLSDYLPDLKSLELLICVGKNQAPFRPSRNHELWEPEIRCNDRNGRVHFKEVGKIPEPITSATTAFCRELKLHIELGQFSTWQDTNGLGAIRIGTKDAQPATILAVKQVLTALVSKTGTIAIGNHIQQTTCSLFDSIPL